jgi:hypothetical protein
MIRYVALIILFVSHSSFGIDDQRRDDILWGYADFLQAIQDRDFESAQKYVEPGTKIGFGGDSGISGFKNVVIDNADCIDGLLFALRQGCKLTDEEQDGGCISRPQFNDKGILYLGPRVKFIKTSDKSLKIQYLVCGGD